MFTTKKLLACCFGVFGLTTFSLSELFSNPPWAEVQPPRVEIHIRNASFEFHGGIINPKIPTTILVKNFDDIRHGFTSELFESLPLSVETKSGVTFGRGIIGVHINPKEQFEIHFTPPQEGSFSFRCDLHPSMKGELLMLSIEAL